METVLEHPILQQVTFTIVNWYQQFELSSIDLALIGSLMASWAGLFLALATIKRVKKESTSTHKLCEKLVHDLQIASSGAIGMGQRIIAMEKKLSKRSDAPVMDRAVDVADTKSSNQSAKAANLDPQKSTQPKKVQSASQPPFQSLINSVSRPIVNAINQPAIQPLAQTAKNTSNKKVASIASQASKDFASISSKTEKDNKLLIEEADPIEAARNLLRRGVEESEVARRCGLSLSETALMAMVLKNRAGGNAPRLAS